MLELCCENATVGKNGLRFRNQFRGRKVSGELVGCSPSHGEENFTRLQGNFTKLYEKTLRKKHYENFTRLRKLYDCVTRSEAREVNKKRSKRILEVIFQVTGRKKFELWGSEANEVHISSYVQPHSLSREVHISSYVQPPSLSREGKLRLHYEGAKRTNLICNYFLFVIVF